MKNGLPGDLGTSCICEIGFWPVWRGVSTVLLHGTRWELCHGIRNAEGFTQKKCTDTILCSRGEVWREKIGLCDPHTSMWATRYPIKRITTRVKCKNKKNTQFTAELQGQTTNKHKEKHKNNKNDIYKECTHIWGTKNTYADIRKTQKMNKKDIKEHKNYRKRHKIIKNNKITYMEEILPFCIIFCMYKCGYTNTRGYTAYKSTKYKI